MKFDLILSAGDGLSVHRQKQASFVFSHLLEAIDFVSFSWVLKDRDLQLPPSQLKNFTG